MERVSLNILVGLPVDPDGLAQLRAVAGGATIEFVDPFPPEAELPVELVRERTVLLADFVPQNVSQMASLLWMQLGSAGYEHMVGVPLDRLGIRLTNASGVNDTAIAEWCVLMMLTFERDLPAMLRRQAERAWERPARFQSELRGRRVGILGYGNIGREVGRLCDALGLEVWAMNRGGIGPRPHRYAPVGTGDPEGIVPRRRFDLHEMADFLPHLDYLILTTALNPRSQHLLGARELSLLRPSAVLLNPARAHLVEEEALFQVLREGRIAGVAIDSHYREPLPPDDPLWGLPNVLITPHISGSGGSPHYLRRVWELFSLNVERFRRGEPLLNEVPWSDLATG